MEKPEILQHFEYSHLPDHLKKISQPFFDMAHSHIAMLPECEERDVALRKLLEAKDCAVRAALVRPTERGGPDDR